MTFPLRSPVSRRPPPQRLELSDRLLPRGGLAVLDRLPRLTIGAALFLCAAAVVLLLTLGDALGVRVLYRSF